MHWYRAIAQYAESGVPYVIASVLATEGSAPRPRGSKMVVTARAVDDSLGGGQLEFMVTAAARELLAAQNNTVRVQHYPLAAAAQQCCGGSVTVLLECFCAPAGKVAVFGAGHVGRRVVSLLSDLQVTLRWYDKRPDAAVDADVPCSDFASAEQVAADLGNSWQVLILTHDHQLDYELVSAFLAAGCERIGLIGSGTKWQRFAARLEKDGVSQAHINRVRCPVGSLQIPGKQPMAIAMDIVAQLLQDAVHAATASGRGSAEPDQQPLTWRRVKQQLVRSDG